MICALAVGACASDTESYLPNEQLAEDDSALVRLARVVHISDTQITDEESPARLAPAELFVMPSWRPHEAYSIHLLDGIIRAINRIHQDSARIDFVVHTGDATDNNQLNEWRWFLGAFDGGQLNPLSGIDDRPPEDRPEARLDPHVPFEAEGLYRSGVHGLLPDIPWYNVIGNHDRFASGVFPIVQLFGNIRAAPLPLTNVFDLIAPTLLIPDGQLGYGVVTPAHPGPPGALNLGRLVEPNPDRRFLSSAQIIEAHGQTISLPRGHGFALSGGSKTWYSLSPVDGLRLIVIDSALPDAVFPGMPYVAGYISAAQRDFLVETLERAQDAGEYSIVCTHHPSSDLILSGTALNPQQWRALLNGYPGVILHLAGHFHDNRVIARGGYLEILTGSTLDYPQEGRLIDIYRDEQHSELVLRYRMFSHLCEEDASDDFCALRQIAYDLAAQDAGVATAMSRSTAGHLVVAGTDRQGEWFVHDWLRQGRQP